MKRSGAELPDDSAFFDDDDDDDDGGDNSNSNSKADEEEDPLDAFMRQNEQAANAEAARARPRQAPSDIDDDCDDDDDDDDDDADTAFNFNENAASKAATALEYDSDGYPVKQKKGAKVRVEPLPRVDHASIAYAPFRKNIYKEHDDIKRLSADDVASIHRELDCRISVDAGSSAKATLPRPIREFAHAGFDPALQLEISSRGYASPTPVQSLAVPMALAGRDLIALASTGSGKTLAFLWPTIAHIIEQPQLQVGEGPVAVVLVPTHELCQQILQEARKFLHVYKIRAVGAHGGVSKYETTKAVKETAPELVVATPGRLIDLLRSRTTNLLRTTLVVLDEADRMFEMGFEYQIRSILQNVRPDRQTLLFSATMKRSVEAFAREALTDPVRLAVGSVGSAHPDVQQTIVTLPCAAAKLGWLLARADHFVAEGKVLVFALTRSCCDELGERLRSHFADRRLDIAVACLHGDKSQEERRTAVRGLRSGSVSVLVATDIAARGLDIPDVNTVINFEPPKSLDTYVHRVGRTARLSTKGANKVGCAVTLLSSDVRDAADGAFAVELYHSFLAAKKETPAELRALAEAQPTFSTSRQRSQSKAFGKSAGLGTGAHDRVAYTSEMAAKGTGRVPASVAAPRAAVTSSGGGGGSVMGGMFVRARDNSSSSAIVPEKKRSRWDS